MRHERRSLKMPSLAGAMDQMVTVVERRRSFSDQPGGNGERKLRETVAVRVWEEADGSETIEIVGDQGLDSLEMKGVLHDAIYALAHDDD